MPDVAHTVVAQTVHITSGTATGDALSAAGAARVIPWADVLHEGPVPTRQDDAALRWTRASFIGRCGWQDRDAAFRALASRDASIGRLGSADRVVLWFSPDLCDQLQVLQVLDRLARLGVRDEHITAVPPERLRGGVARGDARALRSAAVPLPQGVMETAQVAWGAFRSPMPWEVARLALGPVAGLPYLRAALLRHLQEFPWDRDGLARSERQILTALDPGPRPLSALFRACRAMEDEPYIGDLVFAWSVAQMAREPWPLVAYDDDTGWDTLFTRTPQGASALAGSNLAWRHRPLDRWLGGVRVGAPPVALWNSTAGGLTRGPGAP